MSESPQKRENGMSRGGTNNADLTTVPEDHLSVEIDPRAEICRLRVVCMVVCGGVVALRNVVCYVQCFVC